MLVKWFNIHLEQRWFLCFDISPRHSRPERMSESNSDEAESVDQTSSGLEEEGDTTQRKPPSTGGRLWDRVRSSLLRPKVKILKLWRGLL